MSEKLYSISFEELCELEGIESKYIIDIVEYEIVMPSNIDDSVQQEEQWLFDTNGIKWIQKALRLHQDLEIDWVSVAMIIDLMKQNESLQKQNYAYQRQLERFIVRDCDV